jgi:catechol 2,3-dioxygenase-like lactoylglutathione lyase family enzyme
MRLDHIAYRAKDRYKTAEFFKKAFGYKVGTEFRIEFDDGSKADCLALVPPEARHPDTKMWTHIVLMGVQHEEKGIKAEYHTPPRSATQSPTIEPSEPSLTKISGGV